MAAAAPGVGHVLERFRERLREEAGEDVDGAGAGPAAADVVRVYAEALAGLTFNCKPIITELTIIAGEHAALAARGIADAICARIAEVPVDQKLPSLYLLDSIVKNIGREYVGHFAARLQKVFCDAYRKVHPSQYAAMRHLFGTWSQVFPSSLLQGIEDELQFSPSENKRPAAAANLRQSESQSPRPSHGIHVNPKYLEAQHQLNHVTTARQLATRGNRQMTDMEEDQINGSASKRLRGLPAASKLQKSTILYADDLDQQEEFPSRAGIIRPSSPHLLNTLPSILNPEGPFSSSRRNLSRSPPLDVLPRNASPKRPLEMPLPSHSVLGHDPRQRLSGRNGWFERRWTFDDCAQQPSLTILDEEYRKQSARELIDAYGNSQGREADERIHKMQRLDSNVMASKSSAKKWLSSEEEEYSWEDMSPTLTDRSRSNISLPPVGTLRTGFPPRPNAGILELDIGRGSWPAQAPRPAVDGSALNHEDMPVDRRHPGNFVTHNGVFPEQQRSEHTLDPDRVSTMSTPPLQQIIGVGVPLRVQTPQSSSTLNNIPLPTDSEISVKRLATGGTYDALNIDIPIIEKHRSSPALIEWPPLHHTQSLTVPPIPPDTNVRNVVDSVEIRPFISQAASSSIFIPRHQYNALDRKTISAGNLPQAPYQHPELLSSNQQNQATLRNQSQPHHQPQPQFHPHPHPHLQDSFRSFVPNISVVQSSFSVPSAVPPYGLPSMPSFALPPLPPGPPPLQMGPSSSSSLVGGPTTIVSGLLNNLMQQGVIKLEPPSQTQDCGVDFNVDLKLRNESVINALYQDLERQCKTCGLRFKCQEEHRAHMDWHVTKNRNSKNRKQSSRKYFVTVGEWLRAAETVGNEGVPSFEPAEPVPDTKEENEVAVPADEDQTACALCQEPFEDFYSDENEEWMYKGAVYMNAPDGNIYGLERSQLGPIVHGKCRSGPNNTS